VTDSDRISRPSPLVIVLTGPGAAIEPEWLESLRRRMPGDVVASEGPDVPADLETLPGSRGPWWTWLGKIGHRRIENGVVLLAPGLILPERFAARIGHALSAPECPPLMTLPGNHQAGLDPAAGLMPADADGVDRIVQTAADLCWSPARLRPERLAIVAPQQAGQAIEQAERSRCWIYDGLWICDPQAGDEHEPHAPDLQAALGHLRSAIERLAADDDTTAPLPLFGFDERPVVLHISHDWGGGVARWIADLVEADSRHRHLVLSAGGHTDGKVHGQWLKLYAAGPGRACIREWTLTPAIAGTDIEHPQYREILDGLIRRFGVARIVVSSLIGHSLDALASGRPTFVMLHDYYPAWPVLDQDPLAFAESNGSINLERAITQSGDGFLFAQTQPEPWRELARSWLETVHREQIALAAPAGHVLERWRRLVDDPLETASIIAHGFARWPDGTARVEPRVLPDGRLNLVVTGRLSPGKGLALLEAAIDKLQPYARITLLGCGHHGMRFFGQPDVDIVLDYERDKLPRLLAQIGPQAALFLSTVAETWNYALSEIRTLGVVPIATHTGSFAARIDNGRDGILFEPDSDSLLAAVKSLHDHPERIEAMRKALPEEPSVEQALSRINQAVGIELAVPQAASSRSGPALQHGADCFRLSESRHEVGQSNELIGALRADLEQRTDWARKYERLARERTQWAQRLEAETGRQEERLRQTKQRLNEAEEGIKSLGRQLKEQQAELSLTQQDLQVQRDRSQHLERELELIFASRSWRLTRPLRVINRIIANSIRRRAYNPVQWPALLRRLRLHLRLHGLRGALELMQQGASSSAQAPSTIGPSEQLAETLEPVFLSPVDEPRVSIVVPVYNKVLYTSACLNSIAAFSSPNTPHELIVVDDCSNDETVDYLSSCQGVQVIRNQSNRGFIASCNAGAEAARGSFLVFLNNDTTVTDRWLEALIDTFDTFPKTGIVGARLVYPDGRLQEAGGVIFKDGSGWNYGRDDQPDRPEYNFASDADYVSGACLAIERGLFDRLGGFDKRYAPAYYEDTDLCFKVREQGLRVVYQPACTIIHHEGISSGTDESSGTKRYQPINRKKFLQRWQHQLRTQPDPVAGPAAIHSARYRRLRGHVLVIDATTPEPDKDSGSMRMLAILTILRDRGYRVSFMPQNLAWVDGYTRQLQALGIEVLHHPWVGEPESWLAANGSGLELVLVSRHYVLEPLIDSIRKHCSRAALIFDTVDLHFLREERMAELSGSDKARRAALRTRRAELALIQRSDTTLVVSPAEKSLLEPLAPESRIQVLSNIHRVHGRKRSWAERQDLMFVGGFQHPPNLDAAEWLISEIMPLVRQINPEVQLHIIGSRMPEVLRERKSDGVIMHGYVQDITPYLEGCRLSVAPLRYGAGVKGKVNQAMAWGLPVVATACAAEGMYLEDGKDVLVADSAEAFAEAIMRAYNDESLWIRLSDNGLANVERHFSFTAARRAIEDLLKATSGDEQG